MSDHFYIYIHCVLSIARVTSLSLFTLCVCVTYRIPQLVFLQFILIIFLMRSYFHFSFFSSFIPTRGNHIYKKVVKLERFALCKQICLLFFFFLYQERVFFITGSCSHFLNSCLGENDVACPPPFSQPPGTCHLS